MMSLSSSCRPYMGWLGPSTFTATEGCPFLHMGMALCSRSMDDLGMVSLCVASQVWCDLHSANGDDLFQSGDRIVLDNRKWGQRS